MIQAGPIDAGRFQLLAVCTANQCRSPIAEALARRELNRIGINAVVGSAGTNAANGRRATFEMVRTARRVGIDLAEHRSRPLDQEMVANANLVVTMERRHIVDLAVNYGAPLHRTYTLPEIARLAATSSQRATSESVDDWLARIGNGRNHQSVLAATVEEVPDPVGKSMRQHRRTVALIESLIATTIGAAFPATTR